jgi:hypothetical protein
MLLSRPEMQDNYSESIYLPFILVNRKQAVKNKPSLPPDQLEKVVLDGTTGKIHLDFSGYFTGLCSDTCLESLLKKLI